MATYNPNKLRERVKEIIDIPYERMYPYEKEKQLFECIKEAHENDDEELKQEILWEIDVLNRTFGHKGNYKGEEVEEISNKWTFYLNGDKLNTKPFSNIPFCEWKKEALEYYKKRFEETWSLLAKARYAYVIFTLLKDKERIEYAKFSVQNWIKSAEQYVQEKQYSEYYEIPPFAYDFAIKVSISLNFKDILKEALNSLHKSILFEITEGDKRWNLDLFEVESKYLDILKNKQKDIFKDLGDKFEESAGKIEEFIEWYRKSNNLHIMRSYYKCIFNYLSVFDLDLYKYKRGFAESYVLEADLREDYLIKSIFYQDAVKCYKEMQSEFPTKKNEIDERLKELTLKIKEFERKSIESYKTILSEFTITRDMVRKEIEYLRQKSEGSLFSDFLNDFNLFHKIEEVKKQIEGMKKSMPLSFIVPITISFKNEPVKKHVSEEAIFDYKVRNRMLRGIKINAIILKMTLEELEKVIDIGKEINALLDTDEISDIVNTLKIGLDSIFSASKNYIVGVHILTPYIEELIRRIIEKSGNVDNIIELEKEKTEKTKIISFRKIELGGLLTNPKVKELLTVDFCESLKVFLTDVDQGNFRNLLLHGLLESNKIEENEAIFIGYVILRLIKILSLTKRPLGQE